MTAGDDAGHSAIGTYPRTALPADVDVVVERETTSIRNSIARHRRHVGPDHSTPHQHPPVRRHDVNIDVSAWQEPRLAFDECAVCREIDERHLAASAQTQPRHWCGIVRVVTRRSTTIAGGSHSGVQVAVVGW